MLCAIRTRDKETVMASIEDGSGKPYRCPACEAEVTLRKGDQRLHHFAHKPPVTCSYGAGETDIHRQCKQEIYEALLRYRNVTNVKLERFLKDVRPDISAYIDGVPVAIEVQISNLSIETVIARTEEYARRGIYLLWLAQWTPELDSDRYSPRPWEKWVHAAYFGRVYYWYEGAKAISYHFDPFQIYVDSAEWRNKDGEEMSVGGYTRRSKRYRTPVRGPMLNIVHDFKKNERLPWEGGEIRIPRAKLFTDSKPQFWKREG